MARILLVHPGPDFSVSDVHRGWQKELRKASHTVMTYNTNDRLTFYGSVRMPDRAQEPCKECGLPPMLPALDADGIKQLAMDGLYADVNKFWPEVIFFVSAFYMSPALLQFLRTRRHKIVMLHTESPYQDEEQQERGQFADLNLVNDPSNLAAWRDLDVPAAYMPHAYDPDVHYPDWSENRYESDFTFVGTLFKSRAEFFSQMDFTGIGAAFGGSGWDIALKEYPELVEKVVDRDEGYRLVDYLGHPAGYCVDNAEAAAHYRRARCGINFYRRESEAGHAGEGWAMGPREVEMAACGLFFLRDPRPESDEVFGAGTAGRHAVLPSFSSPQEASELLRWWLEHPRMREKRAEEAYARIAARTFANNVRAALGLMEKEGIL
jgi:spore maturation protein CgeB